MANNPVDPWTLLPRGFDIINRSHEEETPQRVYAFLGTSCRRINEEVAIARLNPDVDPVDFPHVSNAIHGFVVNTLRLHVREIFSSALGAAVVAFGSTAEREIAMSRVHCLGPYTLTFIPHDEGRNRRDLAMDRVCWLMLVNFPLDCMDENSIATAISSFGNLLEWIESSNRSRVIIRCIVHTSARIPFSIAVTVGDEPFARCWAVAVYLLRETHTNLPLDTDPLPPHGRTPHPPPLPPQRWMADDRFGPQNGLGLGRNRGRDVRAGEGCSRRQSSPVSAHDSVMSRSNAPVAPIGSIPTIPPGFEARSAPVVAPARETAAPVLNAEAVNVAAPTSPLIQEVHEEENMMEVDHAAGVNMLLLPNQTEYAAEEGVGGDVADAAESSDLAVIDRPDDFPRRRRRRVVPQDTTLLRRSSRIEAINKGFKPSSSKSDTPAATPSKPATSATPAAASKKKGKALKLQDGEASSVMPVYEGTAADASAPPPPNLSIGNVRAIGTGFCKMQPGAVSDKALLDSSDDDSE